MCACKKKIIDGFGGLGPYCIKLIDERDPVYLFVEQSPDDEDEVFIMVHLYCFVKAFSHSGENIPSRIPSDRIAQLRKTHDGRGGPLSQVFREKRHFGTGGMKWTMTPAQLRLVADFLANTGYGQSARNHPLAVDVLNRLENGDTEFIRSIVLDNATIVDENACEYGGGCAVEGDTEMETATDASGMEEEFDVGIAGISESDGRRGSGVTFGEGHVSALSRKSLCIHSFRGTSAEMSGAAELARFRELQSIREKEVALLRLECDAIREVQKTLCDVGSEFGGEQTKELQSRVLHLATSSVMFAGGGCMTSSQTDSGALLRPCKRGRLEVESEQAVSSKGAHCSTGALVSSAVECDSSDDDCGDDKGDHNSGVGWVYAAISLTNGMKIGKTKKKTPEERVAKLNTGAASPFLIVDRIQCKGFYPLEKYLHRVVGPRRIRGELFNLDVNSVRALFSRAREGVCGYDVDYSKLHFEGDFLSRLGRCFVVDCNGVLAMMDGAPDRALPSASLKEFFRLENGPSDAALSVPCS